MRRPEPVFAAAAPSLDASFRFGAAARAPPGIVPRARASTKGGVDWRRSAPAPRLRRPKHVFRHAHVHHRRRPPRRRRPRARRRLPPALQAREERPDDVLQLVALRLVRCSPPLPCRPLMSRAASTTCRRTRRSTSPARSASRATTRARTTRPRHLPSAHSPRTATSRCSRAPRSQRRSRPPSHEFITFAM
jgi:hypothetical protein